MVNKFLFLFLFLTPLVLAQPITLENIELITNNTWYYNTTNTLRINPVDINNSLVIVDYFNIAVNEKIFNNTYFKKGSYYGIFIIQDRNITNLTIDVIVEQGGKSINKSIQLELEEPRITTIQTSIEEIITYVKEYWLEILLGFFIIVFIIVALLIFSMYLGSKK